MSYQKEKAPAVTGANNIDRKSMSNSIVQHFEGELRVSSETVAERTGVEHRAVLQLVNVHNVSLEQFGQVAFEMRAGYNNAQVRVAHLNEQQGTLLMTFMKNTPPVIDFKLELVKQFYAMRQALTPALTEQEIVHQALQITVRQVKELEAKVSELEPKADYVDTFVTDSDLRIFRNVAKSIGMGEKQLRMDLISRKWIYEERSTRWSEKDQKKVSHTRYSAYSDKTRYFTPVPTHDAPRFRGEVMHTLKVTPQGAIAIARLYGIKAEEVELV